MRNLQRLATTLLACALGVGLASTSQAATSTWTWGLASGDWSNPSSWTGGSVPSNDGTATVNLQNNTTAVSNVDAPWSIKNLSINSLPAGNSATVQGNTLSFNQVNNQYFLSSSGAAGQSLTFDNTIALAGASGTVFMDTGTTMPIVFNGTVNLGVQGLRGLGSAGATFNNVISGTGANGIQCYSGGVVTLNAANTFTGRITLAGGTINALLGDSGSTANANSLGKNGIMNIYGNSTLNFSANNAQTFSTTLWVQDPNPVTFSVSDPTGNITLNTGVTQRVTGVASNLTLTFAGAGTGTLTGAFAFNTGNTGVANITKSGSGTWKLTAATNAGLNGTISVTQGTLLVNSVLANNGAVSVSAFGTLAGSGSLANTTSVSGTLAPGNSPGTLTLAALVLNSDATLSYELNALDQTVGSNINDLLQVNGNLTLDGTFNLASIIGGSELALGSYRLINYTGSLTDNTLDLGTGLPTGFVYSIDTATTGQVNLVVAAIPEPATLGLMTLGGLMIFARRKTLH